MRCDTPTLPNGLTRGDAVNVASAVGVFSFIGPMYAGKSSLLRKAVYAYLGAGEGWGLVVVRFNQDTRDGATTAHIETHDGMVSPGGAHKCPAPANLINMRAATVEDILTRVRTAQGARPRCTRWAIFIDEGQFFAPGFGRSSGSVVHAMWKLAHAIRGHVWIACLGTDKDLLPWGPTRDLAVLSTWCRMLYAPCAAKDCSQPAWCSHLVARTQPGAAHLDGGGNTVLIDNRDAPMFEPRCTKHMPKAAKALWNAPQSSDTTPHTQLWQWGTALLSMLLFIGVLQQGMLLWGTRTGAAE